MDKLEQHAQRMMAMMAKEKIIIMNGPSFTLNKNFIEILNSQFKMHAPAMALTLAVRSYCPEASWNEIAVLAGGILRVLEMTPAESKVTDAIKDNLQKTVPAVKEPTVADLDKIMKKIDMEESMK